MNRIANPNALLADLRCLIDEARAHVAQTANSVLTMVYWHVGKCIREEMLQDECAAYGEQVVYALGRELTSAYGQRFTRTALARMAKFSGRFVDRQMVAMLSQQLSWDLLALAQESDGATQ